MKRILRVVTLLTLLSSVTLYTQALPSISIIEAMAAIPCNGENTGSINISPTGGTAPYTFHWSNGSTLQNQSNLVAGNYSVTVKDNAGDTSIYAITVTQPAPITITKAITDENCGGQHMGAVDLTVSGGTPGYTYSWNNGATTQDLANLYAAVYYLTLTDANGCSVTDSANVTQPPGVGITMTVTDVTCSSGLSNGAIAVTVQFGNPAYAYNWSDGPTTQNRTGLTTGNYDLTVTDAIGCTATAQATVTQLPGSLSINTSSVHPTCYNGSNGTINTTPVGSSGPYTYVWNDGPVTQNRTGLAAGIYTVTATSSTGCTASASVSLAQPAQISVTLHPFALTCFNSNNGAITSTVGGGNSPYSYIWNNGDITSSNIGLSSNTYTVTVTDNKGCTVSQSVLVTQPQAVSVTTTTTPITCSGGPTGSVLTNVSGGTPTYSYSWGGGVVSANRTNVNSGTYVVTVTDSHGCSGTGSATIAAYTPPTLYSSQTNIVCYGKNNGSINITVNNGAAPFTYLWSNADTTADIDSLVVGTYTVTVADANSCTVAKTMTINSPPFPITVNSTEVDVSCFGLSTGSVSLNPINGAPPYNFKWGNGATTSAITNLAVGNYVVTITDSSGCKASDIYTVTQPALITPVTVVTNDSCFGTNTGSINLSVTGGYSPFSYAWNDGVDSQVRVKLYAGNYGVTITDNHGCTATASATISQPTQLTTAATGTNPSCFGGTNGVVTLTTNGGTTPYNYNWGGGIITPGRNGVSAGTYAVTVTDNLGCTSHTSATLVAPAAISVTSTASIVACNGGNNGTITLNVTGGTSPYSFDWGGGVTAQNRSNLTAGSYTVTVTDHAGCTAVNTTTVNQAGTLAITAAVTNVSCFGNSSGAITTTVTGGTGPYSYIWTTGSNATRIINQAAGTYTVTVTDHVGCSNSVSSVITQPALLSVSSMTTPTTCFSSATGAIHINVNGGTTPYTYNWGGGVTTQNRANVAAGNYTVSVTDSAGCSVANTSTVSQPTQLTSTTTQSNVSCNGGNNGSAQLNPVGGTSPYSYNWNNGATTSNITGLIAGTYSATVTDANGCTAHNTVTISQPNMLTIASTVTNVACFGQTSGSIALSVNGGTSNYTYNWSTGVGTSNLVGLIAGSYSVTVSDAHLCSVTTAATVTQPAQISTSISSIVDANCFGASNGGVNLHINGGSPAYAYAWSNGATTQNLSGVAAGTYRVSVTDANNCTTSTSINITQPNQITLSSSVTNVTCHGGNNGSVLTSANGGNGGFIYNWSNGASTANLGQITAGNYVVSITDVMNCSTSFTATVTQPSALMVNSTQTNVTCNGGNTGTALLHASGGTGAYNYSWSSGQTTSQLSQLAEGIYTATVSDANACSVSATIDITQINSIVLNLTAVNETCYGQSAGSIHSTVSGGAGGYQYRWTGGATTADISALPAGVYSLTVTDANNCNTSATDTVTQPNAVAVTPVVTNVNCYGASTGAVQISATGGNGSYQYNWSNGATTQNITGVASGSYTLTVKDANTCSVSTIIQVTQPTQINLTLTGTNVTCNGGNNGAITSGVTGGTGSYTYSWSNGSTTANISNITSGSYVLTVNDAAHCTASSSANISQPTAITIQAIPANLSCHGSNDGAVSLQVSGGAGNYVYNWSNQSTSGQLTQLSPGAYSVTILDGNNCSASASANVTQPAAIVITTTESDYACATKQGSINMTVSGGTNPFTYLWQDGIALQNRTGLSAGNYTVTVTDQNHCSQTGTTTIATIPALNISLNTTNVNCYGGNTGTIVSTVTGGVQPYQYSWSNASTTSNIEQLTANAYNVAVRDLNGCSVSAAAGIAQPAAIVVTPVASSATCYGGANGAIQITVTGGTPGYNYQWNNGATTQNITSLAAGAYSLTVTDASHCSIQSHSTITQPAQLVISPTVSSIGCSGQNDGSISIITDGGTPPYLYNWSTSNEKTATLDSLSPGNYAVTVNDNYGCSTSSSFIVSASSPLTISPTVQNASCASVNNGSISLAVGGGSLPYNYHWNNGQSSATATELGSGEYLITVTDAKGCSITSSGTITISYALSVHAAASVSVTNGTPVQLTATTNIDHSNVYNWTPANFVTCNNCANTEASPQQSTVFAINVTDANGCKATDTVSVEVISGSNIFIPNVFTPNDDGVNDQFKIYGDLSNIYYFDMVIFDRWGEKVFESNNPNFEWFGAYKGEPASQGVYIYVATMVFSDGSHKDYKGSLTLLK